MFLFLVLFSLVIEICLCFVFFLLCILLIVSVILNMVFLYLVMGLFEIGVVLFLGIDIWSVEYVCFISVGKLVFWGCVLYLVCIICLVVVLSNFFFVFVSNVGLLIFFLVCWV